VTGSAPTADDRDTLIVGLLVDEASHALADEVAQGLPEELGQRFPDVRWAAQVQVVAPAEPTATTNELLRTVRRQLLDKGWGVGIGFTELPLHAGRRPVTAYASATEGVGLVSVPALGALGRTRRLKQTVQHLVEGLIGESSDQDDGEREHAGRQLRVGQRLRELAAPVRTANASDDGTLRFVGAVLRGNLRLLVGMVRANEPSTVIMRLSGALIGAFASGVAALISSTTWLVADGLGWERLLTLLALSIVVICVALVVAHGLWERAPLPQARERVVLFNLATVATLALSVIVAYGLLFVIYTLGAAFFVPSSVIAGVIHHPVGIREYLELAWLTSSVSLVGGALGSLIESDEAVRDAAYRTHADERIETEGATNEQG